MTDGRREGGGWQTAGLSCLLDLGEPAGWSEGLTISCYL